jgi:hypothetical protein
MADTNFVAHVTTILSAWLQDVNNLCYRQGAPFVSLAGGNLTGAVNSNQGAVAATATTTPLWVAANGNEQIWSNTPTITAFPNAPQAGASRVVYPAAGTIFTNGGSISVQGGANYTTQAGDKVTIDAITTTTFSVWVDVEATIAGTGLGVGQTWQDVTSSRALSVSGSNVYTNVTGAPIELSINIDNSNQADGALVLINGITMHYGIGAYNGSNIACWTNIVLTVPVGATYEVQSSGGIMHYWYELRA